MANKKITELPLTGLAKTTDVLPIVDVAVSTTKKATLQQVIDLVKSVLSPVLNPFTAAVNANNFKITNLATPTETTDATNKTYVDTALTLKADKTYVDSADAGFVKTDGTRAMTGALPMGNNKITGLATPTTTSDAANKTYVDSALGAKADKTYVDAADTLLLSLDGSKAMTGSLNLNTYKVYNVANPTNSQDAANKTYVDTALATKAGLGANTFTGTQTGGDNLLDQWAIKDFSLSWVDKGTASGSSTVTFDYTQGSNQKLTIGASSSTTIAFSNWPASGKLGQLLIEIINGRAAGASISWPTIYWILADGSTTTTFASNGATLQITGTDFVMLWTRDGGSTIYGKVLR